MKSCAFIVSFLFLINLSHGQKIFSLKDPVESGISFRNDVPEDYVRNIILYPYHFNGGGVAIGDINNDGLLDIYFVSNAGQDHLYLNKGNLSFEDISSQAGIAPYRGWKTGVTMADVNGDGYLDIYVGRSGDEKYASSRSNLLFINQKDGTFRESASQFGLDDNGYNTQTAFVDVDLDGDLDAYILNHNVKELKSYDVEVGKLFRDPFVGDKLLINKDGYFTDASESWGVKGYTNSYGLGIGVGDLDKNGYPDLYVGNDFMESDYMYYNDGNKLSDELADHVKHISNFSMGLDIADINNDTQLDIYVVDMVAESHFRQKTNMKSMDPATFWKAVEDGQYYQYMMNTLQINNGNGSFSEIGKYAGVTNTDWSWSPLIADLDNDGLKDIFVSNGLRKDVRNNDYVIRLLNYLDSLNTIPNNQKNIQREIEHALTFIPSVPIANVFYRNAGKLKFEKMNESWGVDVPVYSNGAAYGDLDNDGDLDIVVNNMDTVSFVYENRASDVLKRNHLRVKLEGNSPNTSGIGAKITVTANGEQQYQEYYPTRGFQSSSENFVHFGLGTATSADVNVVWPSGKSQNLSSVKVNQLLTLRETDAKETITEENENAPIFEDVSDEFVPGISHIENEFDDFERELLLPHKMSTFGPALAVADVNGDGFDDFYMGGAAGKPGSLFLSNGDQAYKKFIDAFRVDAASEDLDAVFFDYDLDGDKDLYVVSGGNEFEDGDLALQDRLYEFENGEFTKTSNRIPEMLTSGSVVKPEDYDGDGDLDLFVGGRVVPGRYPFAPRSYLLQNENGVFTDVTESSAPALYEPGLVTDAEWVDLNNDNRPDLVVVGEWMPVMGLLNDEGSFNRSIDWNSMDTEGGWYFSVASADFDKDGDNDIVIGNLGKNYKYKASHEKPFEVFVDDFDGMGDYDIVLGYYENDELLPVRGRQCSSQEMPFIEEKFPTYEDFGKASLFDIFENKLDKSLHLKAYNFEHIYLENTGDSFKVSHLPWQSQLSPINDFVIDDFNGDGWMDILAAGNLYASEVETPRADAGIGVLLVNNTQGGFEFQKNAETGLLLDGDVKKLRKLKTPKGDAILAGRNNDQLKLMLIGQPSN